MGPRRMVRICAMASPRTPSKKSSTPCAASKGATLPSPHPNDSTPLPSINERLAYLRPSRELLEYYRKKIAQFDEEHEELVKRLETYKASYDEQHKLQWEMRQREEEIAELQKALSDMQVYLFQEREHVLRLYSENDRLKIRELEDRKKIQHLLALLGTDNGEITYFHQEPPNKVTILQEPTKRKDAQEKCGKYTSIKGFKSSALKNGENLESANRRYQRDNQTLLLQLESFQAQLQEQTRLSKEQTEALLEDRRIRIEEAQVQHQRDEEKIKDITEKYHKAQNLLYESTRDFLQVKFDARANEKSWMAEKDTLLRKMDKCKCAHKQSGIYKDDSPVHYHINQSYDSCQSWQVASPVNQDTSLDEWRSSPRQRSFTKRSPPSGKVEVFKKRKPKVVRCVFRTEQSIHKVYGAEIKGLKDQLTQEQRLASMYREQCVSLEEELAKNQEEGNFGQEMFKQRSEKMGKRLQLMTRRYEALEKRRAMEMEGFKNDIKQFQKKLQDVEKQLFKVVKNVGPDQDLAMLHEVRRGNKRTKKLQGELKTLKSKIYGLENDLRDY
ncbi:coiled-coil domain-containing protein 77 isoform X1 [Notechis scutatus]|uniref:Coiled-coil domain-containing protein 77 isoform X1 n=2 Tax=Notechis scutatus TaxID=8663 RepID=A0A6J1WEH5_9SAUR|nr:coiled-coil domain-containing protein 77 isoform X1 [Notechis scutatus]